MAISSQDVAFVGAIAAAIAAITGPLTAWLIASSNRSYEERLRYDRATEDAYRNLLRMVNSRTTRLRDAFHAIRDGGGDKDSNEIADDIVGRDLGEHQELRLTFEIYASTPVADAYRGYLGTWSEIHRKIMRMTFSEDQRHHNTMSLFRAMEADLPKAVALRDAIANDLQQRYAGPIKRGRRAIRLVRRETQRHDRLTR